MATSAFKSTTKRSPIGSKSTAEASDASSSNRSGIHRRSRSLSRFSGRFPPPDPDDYELPKGRFVNTVRGSGFPEIRLDDLANEFFLAREDEERDVEIARGRLDRRLSSAGPGGPSMKAWSSDSSQRRGRSVSRSHGKGNFDNNSGSKGVSDGGSRRRRSVSVAPHKCSDSESDMDHSNNLSSVGKSKSSSKSSLHGSTLHNPMASSQQRGLRRSLSQKDLLPSHDGYSSFSSAQTDDEAHDAPNKNGFVKTIRAVYSQKKTEHPTGDGEGNGLYEAVRKEIWHAFEEFKRFKTQLEQTEHPTGDGEGNGLDEAARKVWHAFEEFKRLKTQHEQIMVQSKPTLLRNGDCLESKSSDVIQSEHCIQDLLAELSVKGQRGCEFSKIVREVKPEPRRTAAPEKTSRTRKRSNDRTRVSKCLTEEAEKYFEDFISNVEDTDFSSFDGEKSDASSTVGGNSRKVEPVSFPKAKACENLSSAPSPVEMDGIVLPWLEWEDSNYLSPQSCKSKMEESMKSRNALLDTAQGGSTLCFTGDSSASSRASWSPNGHGSSNAVSGGKTDGTFAEFRYCHSQCATRKTGGSAFDMDNYLNLQLAEDHLFERYRQRKRIASGGLLLCGRSLF